MGLSLCGSRCVCIRSLTVSTYMVLGLLGLFGIRHAWNKVFVGLGLFGNRSVWNKAHMELGLYII